jgi:hypothetical protein
MTTRTSGAGTAEGDVPDPAGAAEAVAGVAAGVPFVALPPAGGPRPDVPVVVTWHLMDAPRTPEAFAAALPLAGLDAWRLHLGLPLRGSRLPAGGWDEVWRLGMEDAVLRLHGPVTAQALAEFGPAYGELRDRLGLGDGPVAVLGGSIGAAVAQLAVLEGPVPVRAAVLVSPVVQLRAVVHALSAQFGVTYTWSQQADDVAERLDFVARARETAGRGEPPVLLAVGAEDVPDGFRAPAERLRDALREAYRDPGTVELALVPGMGHALAEEPGTDPAPQTPAAREVDALATAWLARHLTAARPS